MHTATPLGGVEQGWQADPQVATSLLDTQRPLHRCEPALQVYSQAPLRHCPTALVMALQAWQLAPQVTALSSGAQVLPQAFVPVGQTQRAPTHCFPVLPQSLEARQPSRHTRWLGSQ